MANSIYETLPDDKSIRYIILQAGRDDEPLEVSLAISSLDGMPYFEAVSYAWGSNVRDHEVYCGERSVSITRNLWNVLKDLRLPEGSRTLWVDSLCINQDDVTEKGHQVALMGQIYSNANTVMICLGGNDLEKAKAAASLIDEIDQMVVTGMREAGTSHGAFPFLDHEEQDRWATDERWKALLAMTEEEWFERGWVVQEAGLSVDAMIRWSGIDIPWQKTVRVWMWMEQRLPQVWLQHPDSPDKMNSLHLDVYRMRHQQEMMSLYNAADSTDIFILDLFHYSRSLSFAEQSDRVYALLALADSTAVTLNIQPNYKFDFRQVYLDLARKYLDLTQNIKLLDYIQHTESTIEDDFPSWVPRWDVDVFEVRISSPYGTDGIPQANQPSITRSLYLSDSNILTVRGVQFDVIHFMSDIFDEKPSLDELKTLWTTVSQHASQHGSPYPDTQLDIAFTETLALGRHMGNWTHWEGCRQIYIEFLNQHGQASDENKQLDLVHYWVQSCVHRRRFMITRRGYFGLGPPLTRPGDLCCVLVDGRSPFVLRESSSQGCYRVVGDMYIPSKRRGARSVGEGRGNLFSLCEDGGKDWIDLGLQEQDIRLC